MEYTDYSQTIGSFVRSGDYPLEAEYIFTSVEELRQWAEQNQRFLHDGLLKVVKDKRVIKDEEVENQILFWCYNKEFYPLCDLHTFENIGQIGKFIGKTHTIEELLDNLRNHVKRDLKDLQQELDLTQLSIGLNTSGTFSRIAVQDTNYLTKAHSIMECLLALDKALNYSLDYNAENKQLSLYSGDKLVNSIDISDFIKDGMVESVSIEDTNLVIVFNTDSGKDRIEIPITKFFNPENYYTREEVDKIVSEVESYDDTDIKNRLSALESEEKVEAYDDSELRGRIETLEQKEDADTIYDDTEIKGEVNSLKTRVETLESRSPEDGTPGADGKTWRPSVSEEGELTWTIDSNSEPVQPVNIKGPKGDKGDPGPEGPRGLQGPQGNDGKDGTGVSIKPSKEECTEVGDAYIATSTSGSEIEGHIYIYNGSGFTDGGEIRGPQGPQGLAATIAIGEVTSGDTASVSNSRGTSTNALLDFVLPIDTTLREQFEEFVQSCNWYEGE